MKINLNKKTFQAYMLAFLGMLLILYYIWFRFIRERLPRDIPFTLTVFHAFSLVVICLIYLYIIYRIYIPLKSPNIFSTIYPQLQLFFKPLYILDTFITKNKVISNNIMKLYFKIIVYLKLYKTQHNTYFFIMLYLMPKILLLMIFICDTFYFSKLHFFYVALSLTLIPLFYFYSIHIITQYLDLISNYLDKHYHVEILSTKKDEEDFEKDNEGMCFFVFLSNLKYNDDHVLEAKYFIDCQCYNLIFDCQLYKYTCIETWLARDQYIKRHKLEYPEIWIYKPESDEISKALIGKFRELMPQAYYFKAFIDTHNKFVKEDFMKNNKYIIIGYFFTWLYILVISIHTLNLLDVINLLNIIKHNVDPFSDVFLLFPWMNFKQNSSKQKTKIITEVLSFTLILLGFSWFVLFLYMTFIRHRLPRDIPSILTEFRIYIILFILIIYMHAIKQYFFSQTSQYLHN